VIRDDRSLPLRDALVEVTSGSLTGTVVLSDVSGRFVFREPVDASVPTTLLITKFGYAPRSVQVERQSDIVVTLTETRFPFEGDYAITFAAADECRLLPSSLRRRTYSAAVVMTRRIDSDSRALFDIQLGGADFFPELRTFAVTIRGGTGNFFISSSEAQRRWDDDVAIYERAGAGAYLSLHGVATAAVSVTATSFATTFNGSFSYCSRSREMADPGFPPACVVPPVDCQSDQHVLTGSQAR
jgi:hypothetical protein